MSEENVNPEVEENVEGAGEASESESSEPSVPSVEETVEAAEEKNSVKLGTKETEEAMQLGFAIAKVVKEAKENDGQFSSQDLMLLTKLFPHFTSGLSGLDEVPSEIKDLDEEEVKRLLTVASAHLGGLLEKEDLVRKVEKSLKVALAVADLVGEF